MENPLFDGVLNRVGATPPPKRTGKAKRSPHDIEESYRKVWRSPFVRDTLGLPDGVAMIAEPYGDEEFAQYLPKDKSIVVNTNRDPKLYPMAGATPADQPSERTILAHEIGHAYGPSAFPSYPMIPSSKRKPFTPKTQREQDAANALSVYGQSNPEEGFAQAYTNATSFLSETAADTSGFRGRLGEYEGNTPGVGSIVRDLLMRKPVYGKHPLKTVIR